MSVIHLFVTILGLLLISIVITIINWIYQSRISSRITLLEEELRKKTIEFDTLKKERAWQPAKSDVQPVQTVIDEPVQPEMPLEQESIDDGSIKIFRNIRGKFAPAFEERIESTRVDDTDSGLEGWRNNASQDDTGYSQYAQGREPVAGSSYDNQYRTDSPPPKMPERVNQGRDTTVTIPLLSASGQGADFNTLYNRLCKIISSTFTQNLAFDCGGIRYLSGPELEYLEKIYLSLVAQNRLLALIHCSSGLTAQLRQRPKLAPLIR